MTTILFNEDNELVITTKERIMQKSKNVDTIQFITLQKYGDVDMTDYTCTMEYLTPVSKTYKTEILSLDTSLYKETYLRYELPVDTDLTNEVGKVEIQLTFTAVTMDDTGATTQHIRKSSACTVDIIPITKWSDVIPDSALTALDQKIVTLTALANQLNDTVIAIDKAKADNIVLTTDGTDKYINLTADGTDIGDKVQIN